MRITSRLVAVAAGSTLVLSGLSTPAQAGPGDTAPADAAITWLVANGIDSGSNPGLTGDTALAMAQIDATGYAPQITGIWTRLAAGINDETPGPALAKSAVVAQAAGADASAVIRRLEGKVDDTTGALADVTEYDGVIAQSLAAQALAVSGSPEAAAATSQLLAQQCDNGGFAAARQDAGCTDQGSVDIDSTAFAVTALDRIGDAAATERGRTFLRAQQDEAGSWSTWGTPNANTTGVAAVALGASAESTRAANWLRGLQMVDAPGCDVYRSVGEVADPQGGVVYSEADLVVAQEEGVSDRNLAGIAYATPQAAPALRWADVATGRIKVTGPTRYLRAGTRARLRVSNVAVNDRFCVTGTGGPIAGTAGARSTAVVTALPRRTGHYTARVRDTQGRVGRHTLKVLGRTLLKVGRKARVRRGGVQTVRVTRLAPGERVVVRHRGKVVKRGTANRRGVFRTSFRVGRKLGARRIVVTGQFPQIRKGRAAFRVTR